MNPLALMQLTISLPLAVKFDIIGVVVVIKIQDVGFIHQRAVENMQLQCLYKKLSPAMFIICLL